MPPPRKPGKHERQSTYFVQDRQNKEEKARVTIQDEMLTTTMGGPLPEQDDPALFNRVLDIGCGTGGWAIEAATAYPAISLVGIDISESMVTSARQYAEAAQVADRVEFHVMDTLRPLEFSSGTFDLINMRLAVSFVRTFEWPELLAEFQRVTRHGGTIRLCEADIGHCSSPTLTQLGDVLREAFYNAGNFFRLQDDGLTSELVPLMRRCGLLNVRSKEDVLTYHAGTLAGQQFAQDMQYLFRTLRPFFQKWTRLPENYDDIYQRALLEMQQPDFTFFWRFVTAWGIVKHPKPINGSPSAGR